MEMKTAEQTVAEFLHKEIGYDVSKSSTLTLEIKTLHLLMESYASQFKSNWIDVKERLPERDPNVKYSTVKCLVVFQGSVCILTFNHEHECWDDESGDDYECDINAVEKWMPLPTL